MRLRPLLVLALIVAAVHVDAISHDTPIATPTFSVVLPGSWQKDAAHDLTFTRANDIVYVTTMDLQQPLSQREIQSRVHRIAHMRKELIGDLSRGKAIVSSLDERSDGARTIAAFNGEDPYSGKRFYVAVVGLSHVIVTTAVYRPLTESPEGFNGIASEIMRSVRE